MIDNLLSDLRLGRLFTDSGRACALQLWVLQIKDKGLLENRIIYGRLIPFSFSNNSWSFSNNDKYRKVGGAQVSLTKLNLFIDSAYCKKLLMMMDSGLTIEEISKDLDLNIPLKLCEKFGNTRFETNNLIYRPVAYLLNRDAHVKNVLTSPHGNAGALSASISQSNKKALFYLKDKYSVELTTWMVKKLDCETGCDFGHVDTARFGDLELMVFPTLDEQERTLLIIDSNRENNCITVQLDPCQLPNFNHFQLRLNVENDGLLICSNMKKAKRSSAGLFECKFKLTPLVYASIDTTDVEVFGYKSNDYDDGVLCSRWRINYIREMSFQINAVGENTNPVKFDWLEKTTQKSMSDRVVAALTPHLGNETNSQIVTRQVDSWVLNNRDLTSLFPKLYPMKSDAEFFLRWGLDGEGRLQFVEWFKGLLEKHSQHQIAIFDPYFEDAGLSLLTLYASHQSNYIIFRTVPKSIMGRETQEVATEGCKHLINECHKNQQKLKGIKLRIYGLKEGHLHDRYILITGRDGLPVAGFNLSNSFQKAAENFPLLITPIPTDALFKIEPYMRDLIVKANSEKTQRIKSSISLLFDSQEPLVKVKQIPKIERLNFLSNKLTGAILGGWEKEPLLSGLAGNDLKEQLIALGLLKEESLRLSESKGLLNCLHDINGNYNDFSATWEILGEILAHSSYSSYRELEDDVLFLKFLVEYLMLSFLREPNVDKKKISVINPKDFHRTLGDLLNSHPRDLDGFSPIKYDVLNWAEFFAIKFLWRHNPNALIMLAEIEMSKLSENLVSDLMRLSLLGQIISEIVMSIHTMMTDKQRDSLLSSQNGFMKWMGLNVIEQKIRVSDEFSTNLELISCFSDIEQVQSLSWLIYRTAKDESCSVIYQELISVLCALLPTAIPSEKLRVLLNAMLGHMKRLQYSESWLFLDVVNPLLKSERISYDDACEIWFQEFENLLSQKDNSRLFRRDTEGRLLDIGAFLFVYSSSDYQQTCITSLSTTLKKQKRIAQQPLSSSINWSDWDEALTISMWILIFTQYTKYYLTKSDLTIPIEVENLSTLARELAMIRPMVDWMAMGDVNQLGIFLSDIEQHI